MNYEELDLGKSGYGGRNWVNGGRTTSKFGATRTNGSWSTHRPGDRASSLGRERTGNRDQPEFSEIEPSNLEKITDNIKKTLQFNDSSQKIAETRLGSIAKKKLGLWFRQTHTQVIDGFFEILSREIGSNVQRNKKVKPEIFLKALLKTELGFDQATAQNLVQDIAALREDGEIDAVSFMDFMASEEKDSLHTVKDIIYMNG
jgi:hypothetical protein